MANVVCYANLAQQYRITYDNNVEDAFHVHTENRIIKFTKTKEGLYGFKFNQEYLRTVARTKKEEFNGVTTVAENRKNYTTQQFERAKRARKLYHVIGAPSMKNYKAILKSNQIRNCPVTEKDVDLAEQIFGPDVATIKGKSVRKTPAQRTDETIAIPPELI